MVKKRDEEYMNTDWLDEACLAKCKRTTKISDVIKIIEKEKGETLSFLKAIKVYTRNFFRKRNLARTYIFLYRSIL